MLTFTVSEFWCGFVGGAVVVSALWIAFIVWAARRGKPPTSGG